MKIETGSAPTEPTAAAADDDADGARESEAQEFTRLQRFQIACISRIGWLLVWFVNWTVRYRVENWDAYRRNREAARPVILSFWHNQIFAATFFWRFREIVVITSRHFDGEYIARVIRLFGYGTARGSSSHATRSPFGCASPHGAFASSGGSGAPI